MKSFVKFELELVDVVREMRDVLAHHDIPNLVFTISASGRTLSGDILLTFQIGETYGSDIRAEGPDLAETLDEFLRRNRRAKRNVPRLIGPPSGRPSADEVDVEIDII